jgi:hypothetical protein
MQGEFAEMPDLPPGPSASGRESVKTAPAALESRCSSAGSGMGPLAGACLFSTNIPTYTNIFPRERSSFFLTFLRCLPCMPTTLKIILPATLQPLKPHIGWWRMAPSKILPKPRNITFRLRSGPAKSTRAKWTFVSKRALERSFWALVNVRAKGEHHWATGASNRPEYICPWTAIQIFIWQGVTNNHRMPFPRDLEIPSLLHQRRKFD